MEKSIAAGASRHAMFDAMKIGGVSGWLRAARLAETAALPVSTHVFPKISAHLLAVTPTGYRLEYVDKVGPILTEPVRLEAGRVRISDRAGAGIEWDEHAIAQARPGGDQRRVVAERKRLVYECVTRPPTAGLRIPRRILGQKG
jgi:mandelate racemase